MATIQVTPEMMRSTSKSVDAQINEWVQEVTRIYNLVNQMDAMWDGLGNDSFNNVFQQERPKFDNLRLMMDEYSKAIVTAANEYERTEEEVKTIVNRK